MTSIRLHIPLLVFLLLSNASLAQEPSNEIRLNSPDLRKLEGLTFESVNKLREEKKLNNLMWDDVLYRAAKDHADFLIHEEKVSHFQKNKGRETPAARVKLHGGFMYTAIGENIIQVQLGVEYPVKGKKFSTITYTSSADVMAAFWKTSPGHYRNIISEKFNCTALATSYDPVSQRLIAVQVFAFTHTPPVATELSDYSDQLLQTPIPDLPYGLKDFKGYRDKNRKAIKGFLNLKTNRGCLTGSFKAAKKIFKGRRSGITQEFISLSQFDSTSTEFTQVPNRRNGLYELNGTLIQPVYRRKLIKYSRKSNKQYLIDFSFIRIKRRPKIFVYPLVPNGYQTSGNVFLIKQKQLQTHMTFNNVPAEFFDWDFPNLPYKNSFKPRTKSDRYKVTYEYDTIDLQVYFPSRVVTIAPEKEQAVTESFSRIRGKIVAVEAEAFASVDGDPIENNRLARERMHNFMLLVQPYLDTAQVEPAIVTREQWDLFRKQIETNKLIALKGMSTASMRTYLYENRKDSLLSALLDAQRYTRIKLVWRIEHVEVIPGKSAWQEYEALRKSVETAERPKPKLLEQLEKAQLAVYYELAQADTITELPVILYRDRHLAFQYHDLLFRYTVQHSVSDKAFYDQLHTLAQSPYFPARLKREAIYNNLVLIYHYYTQDTLDNLMPDPEWSCYHYRNRECFLKRGKKKECRSYNERMLPDDYFILKAIPQAIKAGRGEKVNPFAADDLWRYYYLYTIQALYERIPFDPEIFTLLPKFKTYFHPNDALLTDEERLRYAFFYCALQRYETAFNLVKPIAERDEPHKEALKLYLALVFDSYSDTHAFCERLIKEFDRLGQEEWCSLWGEGKYMNFLLLEDLKLKKFYNSKCGR